MKVFLRNLSVISSAVILTIFWQSVRCETIGNQGIRRVTVDVATGNSSRDIPLIQLSPGYGVNISFIKSGEIIEKVWLDNPAFVSLDVDGCLKGLAQQCQQEGATVLHLRRINPLQMPQLPHTNTTLLTVISQGKSVRKVYLFRIGIVDKTPSYHTIEVTPNVESSPEITQFSGISNITKLRRGLNLAQSQRLISPESPLWKRIETFLTNLKAGESINNAARKSGISLQLVNRLIQLGNTEITQQQFINY